MDKHVLLSGYYGFSNAGDEAVCAAILQTMRSHGGDPRITVLTGDPERTQSLHGAPAVPRRKILDILPQADALFQGGGSLLQDATSARSSTARFAAPPVPMISRDPISRPPITNGSPMTFSLPAPR